MHRVFSQLSKKESVAATKTILELVKSHKDLRTHKETIEKLDLFPISLILNEMKKSNNKQNMSFFLKRLESVDLDSSRSICTVISLAKFIDYSPEIGKRFLKGLEDNCAELSSRDIANLMVGIKNLPLSQVEKVQAIEQFSVIIAEKAVGFNSKDRASILIGLVTFLTPTTIECARALIKNLDTTSIFELAAACSFLSKYPLEECMNLFDTTEQFILDNDPPELQKVFTQVLHSFSKIHMGSGRLYDFLAAKFFLWHDQIDNESRGVIYQGFIKMNMISESNSEVLDRYLKKDWNQLSQKHKNTIQDSKTVIK